MCSYKNVHVEGPCACDIGEAAVGNCFSKTMHGVVNLSKPAFIYEHLHAADYRGRDVPSLCDCRIGEANSHRYLYCQFAVER